MQNEFKLKLSFLSLVSMSGLIGFCTSTVLTPFIILNILESPEEINFLTVILIAFGSPIIGIINGMFFGALGFPLYSWLTKKISFKYKGEIYPSE